MQLLEPPPTKVCGTRMCTHCESDTQGHEADIVNSAAQAIARYSELLGLGGSSDARLGRLKAFAYLETPGEDSPAAALRAEDEATISVLGSSTENQHGPQEAIQVDCCISSLPHASHAVSRVIEVGPGRRLIGRCRR